ncbi:MAG: class I SAM-dependent methyltransferase [Mariniblastus sp.]|nr:class I SAM-dependent methyltransferase [Mariniblastus sp.]
MINSKANILELVEASMKSWRPAAWENDISCHSLDVADFENEPPIADRVDELARQVKQLPQGMRDRFDIMQMAARDTFPIPSSNDREGYAPGNDPQYWISGLKDYIRMMDVAKRNQLKVKTYFDFGCATGRAARHVVAQSDVETVWCSDINARHIRWLLEYMPRHVRPIANHCIPSIPIPDDSVDLISAFSVFTHIDTFETCWLAELRRILRPGGLAYLTVHNEATWEVLAKEVDNPDNRLIQSILKIDPSVREKLQQPMPEGRTVYRFTDFGPYRAQVFHSNNYLERVWGRFFDVQEILDCHHVRQSVVVLKK